MAFIRISKNFVRISQDVGQGSSTFFAQSPLFRKCGTKSPPERIDVIFPLKLSEEQKKRFSPVAHPGFGKEGGHNRACGGETPSRRRPRGSVGVAPGRQQIFTLFTLKK